MRHHRLLAVALLAVAACTSGCGRRAATPEEPAMVVFSNRGLNQADVFVVPRSGAQLRIGTVQPGRTDTLRVRSSNLGALGSVSIVARVRAQSRTPSTGQLTLRPGDWVAVTLPFDASILSVLPAS